jgi:hypothetical protein
MSQQKDRLGKVIHLVLGQAWLVLVDESHDVLAGDVAIVDDRKGGDVEIESNAVETASRNGRANRAPVEHSREGKVVDVFGRARYLGVSILSPHVPSNRTPHLTTLTDHRLAYRRASAGSSISVSRVVV